MIEAEEADAAVLQLPDPDGLAAFEAVFKIRGPESAAHYLVDLPHSLLGASWKLLAVRE